MGVKRIFKGINLLSILVLFLFLVALEAAPLKVKVTVDNSPIQATREIGGKVLARVPLDTILEVERKQGDWYKVKWEKEGVSGYIHEMLVEEVSEAELAETGARVTGGKGQAEIAAEIDIKMEEGRRLIREEKNSEKAINMLRPLIARAIGLEDQKRQKELTSEIFYWIGLAYCGQGDDFSALKEFKNMFEVNHDYAKEITRNILDPKIMTLIQQAENEFLGLVTEYSLEIVTDPKEAKIKINGKEAGLSPEICRSLTPKVVIEIEKEGYDPIKEEIFITQSPTKKEYVLKRSGKDVEVKSAPAGAKVYLDDKDTGKVTDCVLPAVAFGPHRISLKKENYADWEGGLEIKEGEPIAVRGTLTANKYQYLYKWGAPQSRYFVEPLGVTVDKENNIYIVDSGGIRLKKITPEGRVLSSWGSGGAELRGLKNPAGVAIDSQGNVYVTDAKGHCVMKYDKNGKLNRKWGMLGTSKNSFNMPLGIALDSKDDVYIVDSGNNRIAKYSSSGALKKIWGAQGTADGNFVFPAAVTVNKKDEVFVIDRLRVQKFSSEGGFISTWGKAGAGNGEFSRPMGICIDQSGYIYVADSGNNRIQKFDEDGKFVAAWGTSGTGDGQMMCPSGVAVDSRGYVYVVERDNNRLQSFGVVSSAESKGN